MRVYYLRIPSADFTQDGDTWSAPIIDLYSNPYYVNYSSTKSSYGTNLLNNNVWTGLSGDDGFVDSGRFIDTTGRIDILNYFIQVDTDSTLTPSATLDLYLAHSPGAIFPDEWVLNNGFVAGDDLNIVESQRYAQFVLDFTSSVFFSFDFYVRVQIDNPIMTPFFGRAQRVVNKFPGWMDLNERMENATPATFTAEPESVGGKFINAISGQWLDNIDSQLLYQDYQRFIGTVDLNQMAWAYRIDGAPKFIYSILGSGTELTRCSLEEFYNLNPDEDAVYWDEATDTVFLNKTYGSVTINTNFTFNPQLHHIWNSLDEIGLLVDLWRLKGEGNESYKARILDVYRNPLGVGIESFKLALRRELNLWQFYGSTPDSDFDGALPETLEISDMQENGEWWSPRGLPTPKFVHLVDDLARSYPNTWGRFRYGQMLWDLGGPRNENFSLLPYQLDASFSLPLQAGVGDGQDLVIYRPDAPLGTQTFSVTLQAKGKERTELTQWPKVEFDVQLVGQADKVIYDNPIISVWLSVEMIINSVTYVTSNLYTAQSDVSVDNPVGSYSGYTYSDIVDSDGLTLSDITFVNKVTGALYGGTGQIDVYDDALTIGNTTLKRGQWNVGTQTYINLPGNTFNAWWSYNHSVILTSSTGVPIIDAGQWSPIVLQSTQTSSSLGTWSSEPIVYHITLNGKYPDYSSNAYTLLAPEISWDNYLASPSNKEYVVSFVSSHGSQPGVTTSDQFNQPTSLDADGFVSVNGWAGWANYATHSFSADTTSSFTFTTIDNGDYPVSVDDWTLQEWSQIFSYEGIIDENGPWRNGQPLRTGNTDYHFIWADVNRADFGIPLGGDSVVTWMGVVSDNPNVVAWLDTNTVVQEDPTPGQIVDDGNSFSTFSIFTQIVTDVRPEWSPRINSGYLYDSNGEFYLFANPETTVITNSTDFEISLDDVANQGAPIIVRFRDENDIDNPSWTYLRRVNFFENDGETFPLSMQNTEVQYGNGSSSIWLAYTDVNSIGVEDLTSFDNPSIVNVVDNQVILNVTTDPTHQYQLNYIVDNSFNADNDFLNDDGHLCTHLQFEPPLSDTNVYEIWWEKSVFQPSTPTSLALSPLFSALDEGFIYVSHDEFDLDQMIVKISPGVLVANGSDVLMITIYTVDHYDNPKPNQPIAVSTTWGSLDESSLLSDGDGFARTRLVAFSGSSTPSGQLTVISGAIEVDVPFAIKPIPTFHYRLTAKASVDQLPADGISTLYVYGKVEDPNFAGISNAAVRWTRGRTVESLFDPRVPAVDSGSVATNNDGFFTVGPFVAASPDSPGYWFLEAESSGFVGSGATWEEVGDIVYWYEYPYYQYGVENIYAMPKAPVQMYYPPAATPFSQEFEYPATYDEAGPYGPATPVTVDWIPPKWVPIPAFTQYELGFSGSTPDFMTSTQYQTLHPFKRDT